MKKFLSLVLALVMICSVATVAFAAVEQPNACPWCGIEFTSEAEYNEHLTQGCNKHYRACQYGCGAGFGSDDATAAHEEICPFGSATCDYCGSTFSPVKAYNDHIDACKKAHLYIPAAKLGDKIKDLDWNNIIVKVTDFFGKVVETIVGLFNK